MIVLMQSREEDNSGESVGKLKFVRLWRIIRPRMSWNGKKAGDM